MADLLSHHNFIWALWSILSSTNRALNHNISATPKAMALYSVSAVDFAITVYFLLFQETRLPPINAISRRGLLVIRAISPVSITIALNVQMFIPPEDQPLSWCTFQVPHNLVHSIHVTLSGIMNIAIHHTHSKGYVETSVAQIDQATNQPLVPFSINWLSCLSTQFELLVNGSNCRSTPQHTCLRKQI
jgi:hypothetical protein